MAPVIDVNKLITSDFMDAVNELRRMYGEKTVLNLMVSSDHAVEYAN